MTHHKINYVEFQSSDLSATKDFFQRLLGWDFVDYGPDYTAFSDEGLDGGFYRGDKSSRCSDGGALIVFYSRDLESTQGQVEAAGGEIIKPIFSFPGGRRFHFSEPGGNELAVWSDR